MLILRRHKKTLFVLVFALAFALGIATWVAVVVLNPLRRSPKGIEEWLLVRTPLGSSVDQVQTFLKGKRWYDSDYGLVGHGFTPTGRWSDMVGEYTLRGDLGTYRPLHLRFYLERVDTEAFWVFDSDRILIGVYVEKYTDSL